MKILLLSDTHGNLDKVYEIYEKATNIDLIIHCGDYQKDAYELEDTLGIPVVSVKGNCDGSRLPDRQIVETPYGNILVTHGHMENAGYDFNQLLYAAEAEDCFACCFGHTHVPMCEDFDGIYLINPGSLPRPRDGSNGSYGILRCSEEDFYANIIYYDTVCGSQKKKEKKVKGGMLRNMLNYSDRF